ncbi:peptide ABC transporter permease [Streptomyces spiroverticillatus]|uniref:Transport permease protein n=1 Tax=Streptomyces finlayi TaxID=67296 RepID=A0A919CBG7_9ACTN|nr:ABC transporter permease [Streptomyces finlayi]GHA18112.1 peptide ABC transporter permease [Streptomyces spiroverticillatus]GHC99798.1 peptide ABC transporter permease [Streptomyces finlayi]
MTVQSPGPLAPTASPSPSPSPDPTTLAGASVIIAGRVIRQFVRNRMMLIVTIAFPLLQLFMLLAAFSVLVQDTQGVDYVRRLAPLIVLTTAFSSILTTAIALWSDIRSGVFNRLRAMPLDMRAYVFGRIGGDFVRIMGVAVLVTLVAHTVGFRFSNGPLAVLGFFGIVALFGMMCSALAVAVALVAQHPGIIVRYVQMPTLVMTLMSSGYVPLEAFPGWIQPVVSVNPVSLAAGALAGLSHEGALTVPVLGTVAWTLGVTAVCTVVATRRFALLVKRG